MLNIRWVVFGVVYLCFVVLPAQIQNSESKSALVYAGTKTYVFVPDQSSVLERNWSWGYYEEWYYIEGEFQFTVDFNDVVGTAGFDWVDGELSEEITYCENGIQVTQSLDVLFHLTDLNCIDGNDTRISFLYEKNNPTFPGADVNVIVTFMGDSIQLSGRFSDECYDGDQYDLDAIGVLKKYGGGLGDTNNPYLIYTAEQMNSIGADSNDWDAHFRLMADINLAAYTGTQFNIIGNGTTKFTGVFDGNGHTISNFTYESNNSSSVGLFDSIDDANAEIKNLGLIDPNIDGGPGGGVCLLVVTVKNGTVTNCYATGGRLSGLSGGAGLVGAVYKDGVILDCYTNVSVIGDRNVGGLAMSNAGRIINCQTAGSVTGDHSVGGLIGYNGYLSEISNCSSSCEVLGNMHAGGVVGWNSGGTISNSYATGNVTGTNRFIGGLAGTNTDRGEISSCYAIGDVNGVSAYRVGGLVGENAYDCNILNSYSKSNIFADFHVGGLVGLNKGMITNCYAAGSVSGDSSVGGMVGYDDNGSYAQSFWDKTINPTITGIGNANDAEVIGESTVNMQTRSTFTDAGWDFVGEVVNGPNDFWDICEGTNYPKFVWQIPVGDFICPDGVTFVDFSVLGAAWLSEAGQPNWDPNCDISEPNDNVIDESDVMVFTDNWLEGI